MDLSLLFPLLILLLLVPILLSGRRQRRQMQQMQQLQQSLSPGDAVMTTSGLRATVLSVDSADTVELEIAPGVRTTWVRAAIRERVEPAADTVEEVEEATEPVEEPTEPVEEPGKDAEGRRATGT